MGKIDEWNVYYYAFLFLRIFVKVAAKNNFSGQPVTVVEVYTDSHNTITMNGPIFCHGCQLAGNSSDLTIHPQVGIWTNTILVLYFVLPVILRG